MLSILISFLFTFQTATFGEAKIEWLTPLEHDFGDLKLNEPVSVDFVFKNTGEEPIIIENVRPSCGCTATDWSDQPVLPGERATIKIEFDSKKPGYFRKKVTVFLSGQRAPEKLYIEGYVE